MDEPRHGRYRKPLVGKFTVRRMRQLTERVEQVTAERLDAMAKAGPPADLVTAFANPVPAVMICELLGVPYAERGSFQEQAEKFMDGETDDDVLSDLISDSGLDDEELRGIALIPLAAGIDTTTDMLSLGTFALPRHPAQPAALREDPALTDRAVEELLRYLSVAKSFMRRPRRTWRWAAA
jgi:cytochrome P450